MKRLLVLVLLFAPVPATAQTFEASALFGVSTPGDIDQKARGIDELQLGGGYTWGIQGAVFKSPRVGFGLLYTQQPSEMTIESADNDGRLFDVRLAEYEGIVIYRLAPISARLEPYLLGGLGVNTFHAADIENQVKFAWSIGGGVQWFPRMRYGLHIQARYRPTLLSDGSADAPCSPFGFCQSILNQFDVMGGIVFRF